MSEPGPDDLQRDEFDEFEVDVTDLQEGTAESTEPVWVNALRRIAQEQFELERDDLKRLQKKRH